MKNVFNRQFKNSSCSLLIPKIIIFKLKGVVGWCDGAGYTSSAGASHNFDTVGQGPTALTVVAGGGCLDIFTPIYPFSPLSPSL